MKKKLIKKTVNKTKACYQQALTLNHVKNTQLMIMNF